MDAAAAAARRLRQKERRKVWRNQLEKTSDMLQQANSSCYGVPASVTSVLTKEQRTLRQRLGLDSTRKQRRRQNPVQVSSRPAPQLIPQPSSPGASSGESSTSPPPPVSNQMHISADEEAPESGVDETTGYDADEEREDTNNDFLRHHYLNLPEISQSPFPLRTLTISEIWAILVAFKVKFKLTDSCLAGLCQTFNALASGNLLEKLPNSKKTVGKALANASSLKRTWITYCNKCFNIVRESSEKQTQASCAACNLNLAEAIKSGHCSFVTLSIRAQLEEYMNNGLLPRLRKNFLSLKWGRLQNGSHDEIVQQDDLDLTIGCDAAQITKSTKIQMFPVVLFINHVPNNYQLRFPILAALYCGQPGTKPPVQLLMKKPLEELRQLETEPMEYSCVSPEESIKVQHRVFVTICAADYPQRMELLNQNAGYYGCPYCYQEGEHNKAVRFAQLVEDGSTMYRSEESRLRMGEQACKEFLADPRFDHLHGIKGLPVIFGMKHFDATWSGTSDALHVIFEGVGKKLVGLMCVPGTDRSLRRNNAESHDASDSFIKNIYRVTELKRVPPSFAKLANWKALDFMTFFLTLVGPVVASKVFMKDNDFILAMIYMSNIVFYLLHGKVDADTKVIEKLQENVDLFARVGLKLLPDYEMCTIKWHCIQHMVKMVRMHGSGYLWDSFNLEGFHSILGKMITTKRNQVNQAVTAFCLKYHASIFNHIPTFSPVVQNLLGEFGFDPSFYVTLGTFATTYGHVGAVSNIVSQFFKSAMESQYGIILSNCLVFRRPLRIRRRNIIMTSAAFPHQGQVNDSFIQLNCDKFGQIMEIFEVDEVFFLAIQLYKVDDMVLDSDGSGAKMLFPDNSFPVVVDTEQIVVKLTRDLFVQKIVKTSFIYNGMSTPMFCIRPNDFFSGS